MDLSESVVSLPKGEPANGRDQGDSPVWVASENLGEQQWIRNMHQLRPIYLHVSAYWCVQIIWGEKKHIHKILRIFSIILPQCIPKGTCYNPKGHLRITRLLRRRQGVQLPWILLVFSSRAGTLWRASGRSIYWQRRSAREGGLPCDSQSFKVRPFCPPPDCKLIYKPHEYYSYIPHKP